jgi:peroxiredoxin
MEAYRDQYATLFNNGRNVVVIGISTDADTTLASWARDADFPFLFMSDVGGSVASRYGSFDGRRLESRALFVVAPDGTIAYHTPAFNQLAAKAYTDLAAVVDRLSPSPADSTR